MAVNKIDRFLWGQEWISEGTALTRHVTVKAYNPGSVVSHWVYKQIGSVVLMLWFEEDEKFFSGEGWLFWTSMLGLQGQVLVLLELKLWRLYEKMPETAPMLDRDISAIVLRDRSRFFMTQKYSLSKATKVKAGKDLLGSNMFPSGPSGVAG